MAPDAQLDSAAAANATIDRSPVTLWVLRLLLRVGCLERRALRQRLDRVATALSVEEEALDDIAGRQLLEEALAAMEAEPPAREGAPFSNVALLGGRLGLGEVEAELLAFAVLLGSFGMNWTDRSVATQKPSHSAGAVARHSSQPG